MPALLKTLSTRLKRTAELISDLLKVDVAIFDLDSTLAVSTENYKKHKGLSVHAPSIEEVIVHTHVMVNRPGHMKSCTGCRFKGKCPARIEILRSIRVDDTPVGVITFTAFTSQDHERITRNTPVYVNALNTFADLIAEMVSTMRPDSRHPHTDRIIQALMDLSGDMVLAADPAGDIIYANAPGNKLFSFCDLSSRSLYQLFPATVTDEILQGKPCTFSRIRINHFHGDVVSAPFHAHDKFSGALIRIITPGRALPEAPFSSKALKKNPLDSITGETRVIQDLKETIKKLYHSTSTLLITGETGTGKGLLARVIHDVCHRSSGPFVFVNCAGIPETLFESELFGYEEGAFTGARKGGKPGRFELAEKGTLVLDEISEIPLHMQAKLLNVLQDQSLERVGGIMSIPLDVRIIAISNRDIKQLIARKKFRSDLYFRLNVIPIELPDLRSRKADIRLLSEQFLKEYNIRLNRRISGFDPDVIRTFETYDWPGNIRELQNVIEYSVNMEEDGIITHDSLPPDFMRLSSGLYPEEGIRSRVTDAETDAILSTVNTHGWDVKGKKKAARDLGISIRTLYRKLGQYDRKQD